MKAIALIIVSEDTTAACGWFNTNAFPGELRDLVDACRGRSALLRFFVRNMQREVGLDLRRFEEEYRKRGVESEQLPADAHLAVVFDATGYLACLDGVFYALKSFLDVYAQLIARVIDRKVSIRAFGKKKVGRSELSGGNLIRWLRQSAPNCFPGAARLAGVIERHSRCWIHDAVGYRDKLTHHGRIRGLEHMRLDVDAAQISFRPEDVKEPTMPDGVEVAAYAQRLLCNVDSFITDTLALVPQVQRGLLAPGGEPLSAPLGPAADVGRT